VSEDEGSDKTFQTLSFAMFNAQEFHTCQARPDPPNHSRVYLDRSSFPGEMKIQFQDDAFQHPGFRMKRATTHRNIDD
jgi:hypothetical protein